MGTCSETICKHRILFPSIHRGNKNVVKIAIFGLTHWLKHRITRKLLKVDRYMLRGVWQALNCLFIYATFCVIATGRPQGKQIMKARVHKNGDFYRAMLCITAVYAVMRCLSVCLSVTFVDHVKTNKHIFEILDQYLALSSKCCNREP